MNIVSVIPLTKIPLPAPQVLDYFSQAKISSGGLVQVSIGTRKILSIVISCEPVSKRKQQIKKSSFRLKPIERVINKNAIVPRHYLKLVLWTSSYYYSPLGLIMKSFLPQIFSKPTKKFLADIEQIKMYEVQSNSSRSAEVDPAHRTPPSPKPTLYWSHNSEKGKINFYAKEIKKSHDDKRAVLFLVPELYKIAYFQEKMPILRNAEIMHSSRTVSTQYKIWEKACLGEITCLIGTRSSLSMPLKNLGLIIVDEEESPFYKSFDQQPYINAKHIALKLAELTGAKIILGSNFPTVELLWKVKLGECILKEPKTLPVSAASPPAEQGEAARARLQIIDMREELKSGNFSILSRELQVQLRNVLEKDSQALLFINRKGLSTGLLCRDCGHIVKCPNCDVPMVFHQPHNLICHHCGQRQKAPTLCPECESYRIKFIGTGTQRVEQELEKFCGANNFDKNACKILRLDTDMAPTWPKQKEILRSFREGEYNILIGTQLILKQGLLPKVQLSSVITIDPILSIPDFRMNEQILRIVDKLWTISLSTILLQTYIPDNYILQNVSNVFNKFLVRELKNRKELSLPPFSQLIKLTYSNKNSQKAEQEAKLLKNKLQTQAINCKLSTVSYQILGPAPAFIPRVNNRYIWQIMIKYKMEDIALRNRLLRVVPSDWKIDVDPIAIL